MRMTRLHILHLIIMAALVSVIAGACRQSPAPSSILQEIDLLLSSTPDSAYVRLQTIDTCLIRSDADRSYYDLLWAESRYKTYHDDTCDSAISAAAEHFRMICDNRKAMRALYMRGCILRNARRPTAALISLTEAIQMADSTSDNLYLGKIYYEMSGIYNEIGDGPSQEQFAKKALDHYVALDSAIFIKDAQLWYAATLSHVGKHEKAIRVAKEIYTSSILEKDTFHIQESLIGMATAELWQGNYNYARRYYSKLANYYKEDLMPYKEFDQYLVSLLKTDAPEDSIRIIADIICNNWGDRMVNYQYYLHIGDYKSAFDAMSREYFALDNKYMRRLHNETHAVIQLIQSEKSKDVQSRLSLLEIRNRWIYSSVAFIVILAAFWMFYNHKLKQSKITSLQNSLSALQRDLDSMASNAKQTYGEVPGLITDMFARINNTYSNYYSTPKEEKQKDYLLEEFKKEIDILRSDDEFLERMETHINQMTDGLLIDVYSCIRKLERNQRRLVIFLYYGFCTSTICLIFDCTPQVFYSRKKRLVSHINQSSSARCSELLLKLTLKRE